MQNYNRIVNDTQQEKWCTEYTKKIQEKNLDKVIKEISNLAYGLDDTCIPQKDRDPFRCYVSLEKVKTILHNKLI